MSKSTHFEFVLQKEQQYNTQGSYGHYKPGKVIEIQNSRPWKSYGKQYFSQSFGKVIEI